MKKGVYAMILVLIALAPGKPRNIEKLLPVSLLAISESQEGIVIETDQGNRGEGKNLRLAYLDLRTKAKGIIYPETADYVLLRGNAKTLLKELMRNREKNVYAAGYEEDMNLKAAVEYMDVHLPKRRLKDLEKGMNMQYLREIEGEFYYYEKN